MKSTALALLGLLAFSAAFAAETTPAPPPLATELAKHRFPLALRDGRLEGPGADWLKQESAAAQFVLIGEDHGLAVMPQFTAALFELARPLGFRHLVVEIGPLAAARLTMLATAADAPARFADFNRTYPYGAAFYQWQEEAAMLTSVVKSLPGEAEPVWGLDQEFIGAGSFLLEQLLPLAPDPSARALAQRHLDHARGDLARMVAGKDSGAGFLISAQPETLAELRAAFASAGPVAARILDELERSNEIYRMNGDGRGWLSNFARTRLAKEHFRACYDRAVARGERNPRLVVKYGAMHAKRGRSWLGVNDLGNLMGELAEFNGQRSLHLLVIVNRGTANNYHPFAGTPADKQAPYSGREAFAGLVDVQPLLEAADPAAWTLIDARPVRRFLDGRYRTLDAGLRETLWGYDAVLVIPESQAATLFE